MNRISFSPLLPRAAARATVSLLFALALLTAGVAAPAAANQRAKASPKRRAGIAKGKAAGAAGIAPARRKSEGRRGAGAARGKSARPQAEPLQAPGFEGEAEADDAEKRENWFYYERAYPSGEIPADARRRAWESRPGREKEGGKILPHSQHAWTPIGPGPTDGFATRDSSGNVKWGETSGRINAIAVHPTAPNVILVGAATGGIWRSADGGTNFTPVSDSQVDLSVGAIAFAPSNPNVVYAGMGDIDNSYVGTGILKSTDAGATWARVNVGPSFPAQGYVTDILVDPTNPDRVYVAQDLSLNPNGAPTTGYVFSTSGVRVSNDGGVTWVRKHAGRARSLAIHPTNPQIIYAAMRTVDSVNDVAGTAGVYKSTNAGESWNLIYASPYPNTLTSTITRDVQVATTPAAPESVYVYVGRTVAPREIRIEVSTDGGANWSARGAGGVTNIDTGQFGYNTYIKVSPANAATIYVGGRDIYKTTNGDQASPAWANVTRNFGPSPGFSYNPFNSNTHPDQQALTFDPANANVLYAGNDGGVSKSGDAGATFASLNQTLSLTQFVHLSLHPTDAAVSYGGAQDNGTQRRLEGTSRWKEFSSGDGGRSVVNPANPSMVFTTYIYGRVNRFTSDGVSFSGTIANTDTFGESEANGATPRIAFYPPVVGNGVDHKLYFGSWKLFVCNDCNDTAKRIGTNLTPPTWTSPAPNTDLTKGGTGTAADVLETIAVARANTNVIYTGSRQGRAMASADGGANWTDVTAGLPTRVIKSITIDPSNSSVAYLTVSGYGSGHVFKTTNGGASWADISNNLPNVPVSAFLIDPLNAATFYAGTDIGVFRSTNGGTSWETFNTGMPPVVVTAFAAQPGGRIQAATYGRGAYELTTSAFVNPTVQFSAASMNVSEAANQAVLTVTRSGDTHIPGSVVVGTVDRSTDASGNVFRCDADNGIASPRCDYATTVRTLNFSAGATSRTFVVPLINDAHPEGAETVQIALSNAAGGVALGAQATMTLTITSDDAAGALNSLDGPPHAFFVRQQYLDFLSREPDDSGRQAWLNVLNNCANAYNHDPNAPSAGCDRNAVSSGFFRSPEFELKGLYVFRFYRLAFGRLPEYSEIIADMGFVAGDTGDEVFARKAELAVQFTGRGAFTNIYAGRTNEQFVGDLLGRYGLTQITTPDPARPDGVATQPTNPNSPRVVTKVTLTRQNLIDRLAGGSPLLRAGVFRAVADSDEVGAAEFNNAFVAMQYYGYLRRTPDAPGFNAWLGYLATHPGDYYTMVNGFVYAPEYRLRFGKE